MDSKKHVFSPTERKHFLDILKKYSNIIENKDTDGTSLRNKNEAWNRITAEYNASPLATRQVTTKQLRRLWINTKQRQREALTKERQHRLATGGRPSVSDADIDPDVSMVAPALIVGIDNAIDSNAVEDSLKSNTPAPATIEIEDINVVAPSSQTSIISDETKPVDPCVQPESPKLSTSQMSQPSILTIPPLRSESPPHSTNTQPHQLKYNLIQQEYKDQSAQANEKHNLEMQILREQLREAKAKADLAELILKQKLDSTGQ